MKHKLLLLTVIAAALSITAKADTVDIDWLKIYKGIGTSIARDANDNVYATTSLNSIFLVKRDKFGNTLWKKNFTTNVQFNYEYPSKVQVDSRGNIIVVGFRYTRSIENGNRANALIILKYKPSGNLVWQQIIDGYYSAFFQERYHNNVTSVLDSNDNIYVASGGNVANNPSGFNVIKLSSAGDIIWQQVENFGGSPYYFIENIQISGDRIGAAGFGQFTDNALLWLLDTAGTTIYTKKKAGISGKDVAFDNANNIYLVASIVNDVGPSTGGDVSVYKFKENGEQVWLRSYDFNGYELVRRILFSQGNLVILATGNQAPNISFYSDWLTIKIDKKGNLLWSKRYDKHKNNDELPYAIAADSAGNIFVTGNGGPFPGGSNLGKTQWVTAKYTPNGKLDWFVAIDTLSELIHGSGICVDSDGNPFVIADANSVVTHLVNLTGEGTCNVPTGLAANPVSDDTALIQWSETPGATLYHLQYKTSTAATWIEISTDQTSYTLRELFPGTVYNYQVEAVCASDLSGFSATQQFATAGNGYCGSAGLNASKEWIDLVYLQNILNSTGNDGGYEDFTHLTANIAKGNKYKLTLSAEFSGGAKREAWSVWIDYNQDGDFDEANELIVRYKSSQIGWETHSFTVPVTAVSGVTKMRVAMKYDTYSNTCDSFARGEVEDYSINITNGGSFASSNPLSKTIQPQAPGIREITVSPNPAKNNLTVHLDDKHIPSLIQVYDLAGKLVKLVNAVKSGAVNVDVSSLQKGMYILTVKDNQGYTQSVKWMKE